MKFTFYLFSPFDILEFYTPSLSAGRAALQTGSLLAGQLRSGGLISRLGNCLLLLRQDNFNVAGRGHVRIDTAVGTVCTAALLLCLVDLDVRQIESLDVQALHLSVALRVLQQVEQELARLSWPATLSVGATGILCLCGTANSTAETTESNSLLVCDDVLKVLLGPGEVHLLQGHGGLTSVLKVHTQVRTPCLAGLGGVLRFPSVLNHFESVESSTHGRSR
mmetsp:Transcript_23042/g.27851  ORF Transcript_23042/g.27851 Transcript_23042/m.27851 type:complete len:221 (+) Transcript_23042:54-716(+)